MTTVHDVVVVGFGPVGATLAGLLAGRGLDVVALDRATEIYPLPRAAHVDHEILRIMQELGCADEMVAAMRANTGMDFLSADHRVLLSMRTTSSTPLGWPSSMFLFQPLFEHQLRTAAVARGADVRLGVGVEAIRPGGDAVDVVLEDGAVLHARFVVGCDGARSLTRRAIGTGLDDLAFEEPWLVVDLVLGEGADHGLPSHALQVCDPARPHTLVPMPAPRFRFEFMLLPGEDAEAMQDASVVESLLAPWLPPGAATLERSAVYTFHGLVAERWRAGRVLLAGDAAHQMPPFLGQGMCSGMRDAANLAWKLDAVLHGAPDELLDTYQAEREPHVRAIVEAAVGFGRIICTLDPEVAAARDEAMLGAPAANGESPDLTPLLTGPLVGPGGGRPALQPVVGGTRLDDVVGRRWCVVARTAHDAASAAWWAARSDAVVLTADHHPELAALLDVGEGVRFAVVRPDRYLLGTGDDLDTLTATAEAHLAI